MSVPWGLWLGPTPPFVPLPVKVLCEILSPMHFEQRGEEAANDEDLVTRVAQQVEEAMQACLERLAREL